MDSTSYDFGGMMLIKDKVYHALKNEIILGKLKPGQQLNMTEQCNRMSISAAPLREALNMLAKDGLISLNPRKHATVTNISFEGIDTVIFLRSTTEPYAARLSVNKIPQERIDEMRVILHNIKEYPSNAEAYISSDLALHELLHQYADSHLLSEIISSVKEYSIRLRYCVEHFDEGDTATILVSTQEHLEILDAIQARNGELVYQRVYEHIMNYSHRLRSRANA